MKSLVVVEQYTSIKNTAQLSTCKKLYILKYYIHKFIAKMHALIGLGQLINVT